MWRECFPEKVVMVNDDKPLLKITDKHYPKADMAAGTVKLSQGVGFQAQRGGRIRQDGKAAVYH